MKVKIKQRFVDKYTKALYKPGMEVEMTEKRANEILEVLPNAIEKPKRKTKAKEAGA